MTTLGISWLAGLLEGEGWFGAKNMPKDGTHPTVRIYPAISLGTTDKDVAERAAHFLGASVRSAKRIKNYKQVYKVQRVGKVAAGWMMTLYPLLGDRRKRRIYDVLTAYKNMPPSRQGMRT